MATWDKLKVRLVFFKTKNDSNETIFKLGNFMFVSGGSGNEKHYVMPTPMHLQLSEEPGKVDKSNWFEIVGIDVFDGEPSQGIPFDALATQSFGNV